MRRAQPAGKSSQYSFRFTYDLGPKAWRANRPTAKSDMNTKRSAGPSPMADRETAVTKAIRGEAQGAVRREQGSPIEERVGPTGSNDHPFDAPGRLRRKSEQWQSERDAQYQKRVQNATVCARTHASVSPTIEIGVIVPGINSMPADETHQEAEPREHAK